MTDEQKKLVRIDHVRCGDWGEGSTYMLVPSEWDEDEIDRRANEAQKSYLKDFAAAKTLPGAPPQPGFRPNFESPGNRSKTVAEVYAEHEAAKAVWEEWRSQKREVSQKYEDYLVKQGFSELWDTKLSVRVDWGHAHGQSYLYGMEYSEISHRLPTPLEMATGERTDDDD